MDVLESPVQAADSMQRVVQPAPGRVDGLPQPEAAEPPAGEVPLDVGWRDGVSTDQPSVARSVWELPGAMSSRTIVSGGAAEDGSLEEWDRRVRE